MALTALILNCTLKPSPETSNTQGLIDKAVKLYEARGVACETIRVVDQDVKFGMKPDMGKGDAWPSISKRVAAADILVIATPIWMGNPASVCKLVIERLDACVGDTNDLGQPPLYNKVAGIIVTGNEDGAHSVGEQVGFALSHMGATLPPNCDTYWVGDAGPGPSYLEAGADDHEYVNKTARYMVHNTTWFAALLKERPIPTDLGALAKEAKQVSKSG